MECKSWKTDPWPLLITEDQLILSELTENTDLAHMPGSLNLSREWDFKPNIPLSERNYLSFPSE